MNQIPEAMIWKGPPSAERIRIIQALTLTTEDGRRFWRPEVTRVWRRLVTEESFRMLNQAIDAKTAALVGTAKE